MFDEVSWETLSHAYGPATDTPAHLAALTSTDADAWDAAFDHLYVAVLHQGFPETATAPAAGIVTRLLAEGRLAPELRDVALGYLGAVADATAMAEEEKHWRQLRTGLRDVVRRSYPVVLGYLDSDDARLRRTAADAAVAHVRTQVLAGERPTVIARLRAWADEPTRDCAFCVLCLGELGDDTQRFLFDPDPEVRVCAALAPSVATVDRATDIVVAALSEEAERMRQADTPEVPEGPVDRLAEYALALSVADSRLYSLDTLISVALARAGFQRIAGPAVTIVRWCWPPSAPATSGGPG